MKVPKTLIFVLLATLFANSIQAQQIQNVTLQLNWKHQFQFAGYYAAIEKGYYKEAGIQVILKEAVEGINSGEEVLKGNAEFGICASDILLMRAQNKNAVVLASIFQHSPQILLASKQTGIEYVHDLVGKRIAIEPHAADIIVYMNEEGVTLNECIINQHTFDTKKLLTGEIDAITAYSSDEPFILNEANFDYTIISPAAGGIDFYGEVLFTTDSLIQNNPELVDNFLEASLEGWKYAMNHQEEIINLIYHKYSQRHSLEHLQFEAERMENLIMPQVVEIGYSSSGRWEAISDVYKKLKFIDTSFSTKGLLYSDYKKTTTTIPWKLIFILVSIVLVVSFIALFFYRHSKKLKNEIKNRTKAEIQIRKLSVAVEQSPITIVITDTQGNIVYTNPKFIELTGYTFDEVKDKNARFLKSGKTDETIYENLWKTIISGKTWQGTFINKKKNNIEFIENATISPIFNEQGVIVNYIAMKEDVTERSKTEIALKNSEAKYRLLFETITEGVALNEMIFNEQGEMIDYRIIEVNKAFYSTVDCNTKQVINNVATDIYGMSHEFIKSFWQNHKENKKTVYTERLCTLNNKWLYISTSPFVNNTFVTVFIDITEQKNTELKIQQQNIELQKLNATKDKLFSIIGHDLRGPIGGFKSFLEVLITNKDFSDTKQLMNILQLLSKSANATYELLENLLSWAKSQRNETIFKPEKLKLKEVYIQSVDLFAEQMQIKQIEIIDNIPENTYVLADKNMLMLVLRNLISNAIKFTPIGKQIHLFVEKLEHEYIITIKDEGIGIKSENLSKLFKTSEHFTSYGTNGEKGTGLGLLLCKEFIEKRGGKIWVESELGKGSEFKFTMPIWKAD